MLVEVNYLDQCGSVCFFCGEQLSIIEVVEKQYNDKNRVNAKTYRCTCSQNHIVFVQQYITNDGFSVSLQNHMFVFVDDLNDYIGIRNIHDADY